jgi:hypothetical protein
MPDTTNTAAIRKHWIVGGFTPPDDGSDPGELGALGAVQTELHSTLDAAKQRCRELAAGAPGAYFVVYEALWYAYTDITPVTLRKVGEAVVV